jgi:pimeloyl-ACP methyl ester carboxylesterase
MPSHSETTLLVCGTETKVLRGGEGPPLLFLSGAGSSGEWQPFMNQLANRFDVIAPRHPGFGGTEMPGWLDNIHDMAYFYLDLLSELDLMGVHLVGLSLGGWIAAEMAVRNTSRLASLTLVDAAGIYVKGVPVVDTFRSSDEQRVRDMFHDQTLAEQVIARTLLPEREDLMLRERQTAAKLMWQPRSYDPHLAKWLHRIDVPTLVLWGENDKLFPREYASEYQRLIPGSKAVLLPDCGHLPNLEKADEFVGQLTRFIAEQETSR